MAFLAGWSFRKQIDIQDANVDGALTDFPVYVPLKADADFHEALATGFDIRFTQSDGETLLFFERESWSGGNGSAATADFWVKVPSIASTGGATIYIYYGNGAAGDASDGPNTWDANFKGVWHLNSSLLDSSGNGNTLTASGADSQAGKIANGYEFDDASSEYLTRADLCGVTDYPFTFESWFNSDDNSPSNQALVGFGSTGVPDDIQDLRIRDPADSDVIALSYDASTAFAGSSTDWSTSTWHYAAGVFTSDTARAAYLDGAGKGTNATSINFGPGLDNTNIGRQQRGGSDDFFMSGLIDEVRISDSVRADEWVKFTYFNINEADNELTFGGEEVEAGFIPFDFSGDLRGGMNVLSGGLS